MRGRYVAVWAYIAVSLAASAVSIGLISQGRLVAAVGAILVALGTVLLAWCHLGSPPAHGGTLPETEHNPDHRRFIL